MNDHTHFQPLGGNEMPRCGGIATMMRLPHVASAEGLDACFVGVPFDLGTSNRTGARFGPRQIRTESVLLRPYNMATRAAPFDSLQVADIGDVATNPYDLKDSVRRIEEAYDEIVANGCRPHDGTLVAAVQQAARASGWQASGALVANLVGLLSQTCEATAAWLGNTLVAWHGEAGANAARVTPDDAALDAFVGEVGRFDSPVQNTRRFVASRSTIEGVTVEAGDAILVVLAAANRDPAVHRDPQRFMPGRAAGPNFGFGTGPHGCPGERIARAVTAGAFGAWLRAGGVPPRDGLAWDYRASTNVRMPKFDAAR